MTGAIQATIDCCARGHEQTPENSYIQVRWRSSGLKTVRICRVCHRENQARYVKEKRDWFHVHVKNNPAKLAEHLAYKAVWARAKRARLKAREYGAGADT